MIFLLSPVLIVYVYRLHPEWLGLQPNKSPKVHSEKNQNDLIKIQISQNQFENFQKANLSKAILQVETEKLKEKNEKLRDSLNTIIKKIEEKKDSKIINANRQDDLTKILKDSLIKLSSNLIEYKKSKEYLAKQLDEIQKQNKSSNDSLKIKSLVEFAKIYNNSNPSEVAKILEKIDKKDAILILKSMQKKKAGKVIEAMKSEVNADMIKALSDNSK
ncbi:MAG: hypothetical protein N2319_06910 [Candidatus Kapabacteria bacterium]|nr:hypothetical protein [Candidatus Kapabacteria bacterium]